MRDGTGDMLADKTVAPIPRPMGDPMGDLMCDRLHGPMDARFKA
jgi:hypothetical protein